MSAAPEHSRHGHVFRPGPFRQRRAWWLDGHVLHWRIGNRTGRVPLADIASMRLDLPEGGEATTARCELVEMSGRTHHISDRYWFRWTPQERHRFGRHQRRTMTFQALCFTLVRRLSRTNPQAQLLIGASRSEWIATCLMAAATVTIIVSGAALMIAQRTLHYSVAAFMALAALYLALLIPVIRSGGPKHLDPKTLHNGGPPPGWVDW